MKKIGPYEIYEGSAISISTGDAERQPALKFIDTRYEFDNDSILFGYTLKDLEIIEDIENVDYYSFSTAWEDIASYEGEGKEL